MRNISNIIFVVKFNSNLKFLMKLITSAVIALIFIFTNQLKSNTLSENIQADKEVLEGLNDIYNLRFEDAENRFRSLQKTNPSDLRGYFYESILYFYKALPSRDNNAFEKYIDLSEIVIEKAENILDKNENDYDALYYKGLSHSYRSLLMLSLNKSLLKAASNGNDGYRILTSLINKNPQYYDAYMGIGLYKIAIGFVPQKYQWLLSMIGFSGNIKEGMSMLRKSMENGKYTKVDSKVFLSIFSLKEKEEDDKQSLIFSKELTEAYPESPVFRVFYSSILLQFGKTDESIANARLSLEENKYSLKNEIVKSANAVLGSAYFRLNDYQKAISYLEDYMKYVNPEDRYNVYLFTLGVSYELSGNRQTAVDKYKKVRNNFINERDGELDKFFYRLAQEKIKKPLNEFDINLIKAMNLRESLNTGEAISIYKKMADNSSADKSLTDDDKLRLYYDMGVAYTYSGDWTNAAGCFNKCTGFNPQNEKWLVPHSYFELGKIYYKNKEYKKSEEMFDKIYGYDDFDFESFLDMRLANYQNK